MPGVPVGQIAGARDLVGAHHADVEMAAAHHGEGVRVVEVRGTGQLGDLDLAGVDQVGVDLVTLGFGAHAEHAVLRVQHYPALRREVIGDPGGQPDTEVDIRPGRDVRRDDPGHGATIDSGQRVVHSF